MIEKKRLDVLVFERGLAPSREKARALIMAGQVYVDNQKSDKPGTMLPETVQILRCAARRSATSAGAD